MRRALFTLFLGLSVPARADLGLNVYGLSYHFDQDKAHELGVDNQFNPGLGVRLRAPREAWDWFADAGFYRDSGRHTATLAGGGVLWHVGPALRLGGAVALMHSETYNNGRAFIAPLPVAAYELGRATLNMVYMPKVHEVNDINTLGFWATIWLR
jgi:hypothetical protein